MAKRVQFIRHSTGSADAFTGLLGELTGDTTRKEVRVHDGLTAGGNPQARRDLDNVLAATSGTAGKMTAAQVTELTNATANIAAETATRAAADVTLQNNIDTLTASKVAKAGDTMTGTLVVNKDGVGAQFKSVADVGAHSLDFISSLGAQNASFGYSYAGNIAYIYHTSSNKYFYLDTNGSPVCDGPQGAVSTSVMMKAGMDTAIAAAVLAVKQAIFPVGSLYISPLATNPNTLLGFGTWALHHQDRMLMSAGSSYALGTTGGTKDSVVVAHTHFITGNTGGQSATHNHQATLNSAIGAGNIFGASPGGAVAGTGTTGTASADHTHAINFASGGASGGVSGTNQNLPPYIAVNIWQRTA